MSRPKGSEPTIMAAIDHDIRAGRRFGTVRGGGTAARADAAPDTAAAPAERLSWPLRIYLAAVMLPVAFYVGPIYMTTLRLVLIVAFVPLMVMLVRGRFGRILPTDILFVLYLCWAAIAWMVHHPYNVVQHIGSSGIEFLGGYLVGRAYVRTRGQFIALCRVLGILIAITLPFALYESQTNRPILIDLMQRLPLVQTPEVINYEGRLGLFRSQIVFAHPIHYGMFCSLGFALSFVALRDQVSTPRRYVVSALVGICTFMSLSSGAILAVAIQLMLLAWYWTFRKIEWRWLLLLGLFALAYVVVDILSTRTPVRVFMSYAAFSAHNAFWRGLINEWGIMNIMGSVENGIPPSPWFGIGARDWVRPAFMHSASVDNFWLATAMRYGIPGAVLLVLGYALALLRIGLRDLRGDVTLETLRRAWMFTFVGATFTLITVHVWTALYSFTFFLFGAGMWLWHARPQTEGDAEAATGRRPAAGRLSRRPGGEDHTRPQAGDPTPPAGDTATQAEAHTAQPPASRYTRFPAAPDHARPGQRSPA
jgi:hypothetical protein